MHIMIEDVDIEVGIQQSHTVLKIPHILESNPHPNLIRTSFCRFLKRKKKKFAVLIRTFPSTAPCAQLLQKSHVVCRLHGNPPRRALSSSFKKCCISNVLDGSDDDILWEDDGEDKDDSDWVTDNDSIMSDDGRV